MNGVAAASVRLLGRTLGATIHIRTETSGDSIVAFVDPGALEAAVLNIALNARDAMPDGGTLTIRTSVLHVSSSEDRGDDLPPGDYASLALQDEGCGMPPDVAARVFEPFFTTKSGGRGSGLGLSMVYGFAKQSGGTVTIDTVPDHGTTVTMLLPLARADEGAPAPVDVEPEVAVVPRTVLVVEDEADVRSIVRRQVESLGHRALAAEAATEALLLLQGPGAPDVLLTDVVLATGVDGIELARQAREARPGLPVIFMSGFTAIPEAQARIRRFGSPLLTKPFTSVQLGRAIAGVCEAAAAPRK